MYILQSTRMLIHLYNVFIIICISIPVLSPIYIQYNKSIKSKNY